MDWAFLVEAVAAVAGHGVTEQIFGFNYMIEVILIDPMIDVFRDGYKSVRERPLPPVGFANRDIHDARLVMQAKCLVILLMYLVVWRCALLFLFLIKELLDNNLILLFFNLCCTLLPFLIGFANCERGQSVLIYFCACSEVFNAIFGFLYCFL